MSGPPVVRYCVSCRHPAHLPAVCGVVTFYTHTCTCPKVYDPRHDETTLTERGRRALADAGASEDDYRRSTYEPDFDERKAYREHDDEWYPDERD